jgi:hypothetical protein
MDKDYEDFVARMGSFDDTIEIPDSITIKSGNDIIKHHGILGMKWGHKKINADVVGKAAKTGQDIATLGQTVNRGGFNKKSLREARNLSDDDLKKLTTRLNLENNYINAKNQQSGRSKVEGLLSTAGSALAVASSAAALYTAFKKAGV